MAEKPRDVDEYIAQAPAAARPGLQQMRSIIRDAVPEAEERISYGIPFYQYHGRLVYFAAAKNHISLHPFGEDDARDAGLLANASGRATLRFPLDRSLPRDAITMLVRRKAERNLAATAEP